MLAIGIFAPYGTDHDRNIAFCHDTDVHHIVLSAAGISDEDSIPSTDALKDLVQYADAGITLAALTPERIRQAAFSDPEIQKKRWRPSGSLSEIWGKPVSPTCTSISTLIN